LGVGEEPAYRMMKEIWKRNTNDFTLRVDGRVVGAVGGVATPFPLDSTKVLGNITVDSNGEILPDTYDFFPRHRKLNDYLQGASTLDNVTTFLHRAKTFSRNQLNEIAIQQHGQGSSFRISFEYTDNALLYGKKNIAPWRPDIDPQYAKPYKP
jgi:hypothetical protein